jgi:GDP-mannose 6-dehydrogenase
VVGSEGEEPKELKELLSFDANIPLVFTDYKTAEFVKYVDNAFHAMKIAFVNEIYSLGSSFGIDVQKANDIFLMDTHLNVSKNYLRPGLPFGGSCLPKDLRAIQYFAKSNNVQMPVIGNIINSNTMLLDSMLEKIISKGAKSVSLYGLTFKSGTDDVRESPMLRLLYSMVEKGIEVKVFDHDINLTSLRIEHAAVVKHVVSDADQAFSTAEVIIVCKKGFEDYSSSVNKNAYLFNFYSLKNFNLPNSQEMLYS